MKLSIRVKTVSAGIISVVRIDKRNITKIVADDIIKGVKGAIPDPIKVPQIKGSDRVQVIIKVDGKNLLNQKIKGLKAHLSTVALIDQMTKEIAVPVTITKKPIAKKPVIKK